MSKNKQVNITWWVTGAVIALSVGAYFLIPSFQDFCHEAWKVLKTGEQDKVSSWIEQYGFWGPVIIIFGMVLQMFLFVVPSVLLMTVSILAYGPWLGSLYGLTAIVVASCVAYFLGNTASTPFLNGLIGEKSKDKMVHYVEKYGSWIVALARINPILSNDTVSLVGGLVGLRFWKFLLATIGGSIPLLALISYLGESEDRLKTGMIWISAIGGALALGYVIYEEVIRKKD